MKKITLALLGVLSTFSLCAQPWQKNIGDNPVKLADIVSSYKANVKDGDKTEKQDVDRPEEDHNYHFERWKWYWERHTDDQGYLVSPIKAMQELKKLERSRKAKGNASKTTGNPSNWVFQGPDSSRSGYNGIGRINSIAFHPTDTNIIWVGSAGGGVWKTQNAGTTWTAVNDNFPVLGVSDIEINPQDPNTIYICTGDKDAQDTHSVGVLKSTDGGITWDTTGFAWNTSQMRLTNDMVINRANPNSLTLATNVGMYKSYNAGATWNRVTTGHFKQVLSHPTDTAILYATTFGNMNNNNQVMRSNDGGTTWTVALSIQDSRRIVLAVTPANGSVVKAVVANLDNGLEGIYHSVDAGMSFSKIFEDDACTRNILANAANGRVCGGQGWYDLSMAINPQNANEVVVGGVNTWYSVDGGYNWTIATQWTTQLPGVKVVHADKHFHGYHPLIANRIYEGNDGGIYYSNNPASGLWTDITFGMGITQFYRNAVSNNAAFVIGGSQDNGTKKLSNGVYTELTGGDGMDCQIDYTDANIFYTSQQYGELRRTTNGGAAFTDIHNNIPDRPRGEWITPIIIHPDSANIILAGYNKVFMSNNRGATWTAISDVLSSGNNIKRLAISPANPNFVYAIVANAIYYTRNFGTKWQLLNMPYSAAISDIHSDPHDTARFWVTFSGYSTGSTIRKVAEYNAGKWALHNDNLPNIPVNCIVVDSSDRTLYIGTDFGVYYKTPLMTAWEEYNNALPNAEVIDLGINYTTGELWAATYGRGMWKSPKNNISINPTAVNAIPLAKSVVMVYPNPNRGNFEINTDNKALINQKVAIRIMGISGNVVWQNDIQVSAEGKASIEANLPQGSYIIHVGKDSLIFAKEKIVVYQ
ncbi:MAG: T9SS type A sorting domain-containing protein [Sphingobacteriales bacterium]|nr:MAG: T9SS type A sorting domain-containing protein [Sphingobacteriales bacterium]